MLDLPQTRFSQAEFAAALINADMAMPEGITGSPNKRLAVYRNNVMVSLVAALGDIFPTIRNLVGDEFFAAMAQVYIGAERPTSPLLFEYGAGFADFLAAFEPARDLAFLPDVARLERAWLDGFHEADTDVVALAEIGQLTEFALAAMRLKFHPAVRILDFDHAAVSIVSRDRQGQSLDGLDPFIAESGLLTRPDCDVELRYLPPGGADFLRALDAGQSLGAAAADTMTHHPDFDLPQALCGMFIAGAVSKLIFPGDP